MLMRERVHSDLPPALGYPNMAAEEILVRHHLDKASFRLHLRDLQLSYSNYEHGRNFKEEKVKNPLNSNLEPDLSFGLCHETLRSLQDSKILLFPAT